MFKEYSRVFKFVKPHTGMLILAITSMAVANMTFGVSLGMLIPFVDKIISDKQIVVANTAQLPPLIGNFVGKLNALDRLSLLRLLLTAGIILFVIKQAFEFLKSYFMSVVGYRFMKDIREEIYRVMIGFSLDFYSKNPTGKLTSKIMFDTAIVKDSLIEGLTDCIYQPILLLVCFGVMICVQVYFGIPVALIIMSLGLTLLIIYPVMRLGRHIKKISRITQERIADINMTLFETITGISIVHAFSMQEHELDRLKSQNKSYYKICMKSVKLMLALSPMTELIAVVCVALVVIIGGRSVIVKDLSPGAFTVFLAALISLLKPFKRLSRVHVINQQALGAAGRVFEIIEATPTVMEKPAAAKLAEFKNAISYEGVFFRYEDADVLRDVTFRIQKGEIAAFVGPSGVGKTTLLNLLPRFYDPQRGAVTIDGINIKDVTLGSLREKIGIVTQDAILFNDTVAQNIAYGRDVASSMEAISRAAKAANCHNFVMNMPQGYETVIGERGFRLSGGEKQRLCIARAIFKNPPILILDEATSQLDTESEMLVQEAIDRLMEGRTVLVIAHRLSTIKHATRIYVMEGGRIAETGSHDELMVRSGLYKRLYTLQFRLA